jgi:hypothetical protein
MNQLTKFLVDSILNEGDESLSTVALFGGGFKPPTKGHLDVVLQGLRDNPEVKQVYILVGSGVRNGITQEESVKIWKIYKRFIPVSTQIVAVQSPFSYIKTYLQDHQDENVYIFIGARPDNDEDEKDVAERSAYAKKYSKKAFPVKVTTPGNISGTKARAAAKQSKEAFYQFIPDQLSIQDKEEIYNIILPTLNEVGEGSSKPYEWREDFDEYVFTTDSNVGYIVSLSEMSEGGKMGIAVEFLAKTPEMDGYSSKIEVGRGELFRVMATIIDIIKSHLSKNPEIEFILYSPSKKTGEGDIGNQRDKLYKIFLQKQIPGIRIRDIGTSAVIAYLPKRDELNLEINKPGDGNAAPYGSGYNKVDEKKDPKKGTGKKSKGSDNLNENASYSKDIDVKGKILELTKHMLAKGMNIKPLPKVKFVNGDSNNAREFLGKTAYYNPENQTITLYTEGRHPKDIVKSFSHEMIHHIQNLEDRLGDISTTNTMKDDHLDKLEQEANLKGTMTFRNWTDSLNEDLSNISLDYIKTKLLKLDSYPKSDIILSKGDFVYLEIPQDANNPYSMVYEIKVFDIKDGTLVAQSSFDYDDNNKLKGTLDVRPDKRRMGIATEIYKLAEKIIGDIIFPEEKHTEDAEKFWRQKNRSFGPQNYDSLNESLYLDIPKFSQPKTFKQHLIESINEISLSKNNAVEINGDLTGGNFTVGDIIYEYSIKNIPNPYKELGLFYNIQFTPTGEIISTPQMGKENYIKILSTMYKIIVDFIEKEKPEYVGIASLDNNGKNYHQVYANLTDNKSNNIPGYFRKDVNLEFNTPEGKGRFIVLKKKDSLNEVKYTNPNFELEWEEAVRYPEFKEMGKENWIKVAKQGKLVNYSSIKDVLGNVDLDFDNLEEPKKQRFQSAFKNGTVETPIAVKFSDNDYDLVAGNTRLSGLIKNGVNPKIWVIDISNIQEKKNKDPFGLNQFAREIAEEVISEGRYDTLANKLSSIAFKAFKDIHDRGDKEGSFKFRVDTPDDEHDIPSEDFYFDFEGVVEITDGEYGVDGGANAGFDTDGNEITPLLSVKFKIPKNPSNIYPTWQDISFDIKDVIRHELEHLTQDGDNEKPGKYIEDDQLLRDLIDAKLLPKAQYFKLEKEIDAMLQGLYFKAKKLKRPYKKVIDDYLATQSITQEEKNDILKIWRSRAKSLSLPLFESEGISELFTIYLDIDGVIADFDKRFTELAGMGPREYEDSFGSEKFWDFIDIKHKIKFFSKMDWMPEGKKLYNFIKQFDHKLLSAPSKNDASKVGKRIWAKENTPETQLILSPAYNKKNYADKSNILIDDREKISNNGKMLVV